MRGGVRSVRVVGERWGSESTLHVTLIDLRIRLSKLGRVTDPANLRVVYVDVLEVGEARVALD